MLPLMGATGVRTVRQAAAYVGMVMSALARPMVGAAWVAVLHRRVECLQCELKLMPIVDV